MKKWTAGEVIKLYHRFLKENSVTPDTVFANVLWKWKDYLREHGVIS